MRSIFVAPPVTYYLPSGEALDLDAPRSRLPVAERFETAAVREAIREAQASAPGFTYRAFCEKIAGAGCAG
jgi:uncharacterized protein YbcV (DUF1398 family)